MYNISWTQSKNWNKLVFSKKRVQSISRYILSSLLFLFVIVAQMYLLLSLQDQKFEIASSRYQKVNFLESAGSLII